MALKEKIRTKQKVTDPLSQISEDSRLGLIWDRVHDPDTQLYVVGLQEIGGGSTVLCIEPQVEGPNLVQVFLEKRDLSRFLRQDKLKLKSLPSSVEPVILSYGSIELLKELNQTQMKSKVKVECKIMLEGLDGVFRSWGVFWTNVNRTQ